MVQKGVLMKSFKINVYTNNSKEENWDIVDKADKLGFQNVENFRYIGYEICFETKLFEDGTNKVLKINGVDVSDKDISI